MPSAPRTVEFSGLKLASAPSVYPPHEDSVLLAEAARLHAKGKVLDLGCGSGIIGLAAAQNKSVARVTFADVNPAALALAKKNATANKLKQKHAFVQTDLFAAFSNFKSPNGPKTAEKFDTICFNPPYLPTADEEKLACHENAAYDGGKDGRKVLDRFLKQFPNHLANGGTLLLLNSSVSAKDGSSGNERTGKWLEKKGFQVEEVGKQAFFFEKLVVFKITN